MHIENIIKTSALEEDHLADLLIATTCDVEAVITKVMELLSNDSIELYFYNNDQIKTLPKKQALDVVANVDNWVWSNNRTGKIDYFLVCK